MQIGPGITFGPNISINPPAPPPPPNYTTSGLVLYLDAGNINSYNPAANANAWLDLSGTGNHANVRIGNFNSSARMNESYFDNSQDTIPYPGWENDYAQNHFLQSGVAKVEPSASLRSNDGFTWEVCIRTDYEFPGPSRRVWLNIGGQTGVRLGAKKSFNDDTYGIGNFIEVSVNQQTTDNVYATGIPELYQFGAWAHIVGTYDKTNIKLYVNTNLSTKAAANSNINYVGAFPLWIGGINTTDPAAYPDTFQGGAVTSEGDIAVVRIYNRALTSTEVTNNYNQLAARYSLTTSLTL